ncbi:MAG: Fe-S cluster assembly protein SufB, partial [Prevotella sp.]
MKTERNNEFVKEVANQKYEFGFTTNVETDVIPKGLNEDIVRLISKKKGEPDWLLEFSMKAYRVWSNHSEHKRGQGNVPPID